MDILFDQISLLKKQLQLIIDTEEAEVLMRQEVKTKVTQHNRWKQLRDECVKNYGILYNSFDSNLEEISNSLSKQLANSDPFANNLFYAQIFDLINELGQKFNDFNSKIGFSGHSIGTKFQTVLLPNDAGELTETKIQFDFSIAMLAEDISDRVNMLQKCINQRFKLWDVSNATKIYNPTAMAYVMQCYYENNCDKNMEWKAVNRFKSKYGIALNLKGAYLKQKNLDKYNHTEDPQNIREFIKIYEYLLNVFRKTEPKHYEDIKKRLEILKETYLN